MDIDPKKLADLAAKLFHTGNTELAVRLGEALELTDALRELVPLVVATGTSYESQSAEDVANATPAGLRLDQQTRSRLQETAREWETATFTAFDSLQLNTTAVDSLTAAEAAADPVGTLNSLIDLPTAIGAALGSLPAAGLASIDEILYLSSFMQARTRSSRTPMLLRALFVNSVGTIETLVTRMVHLLLHHTDPTTYPSLTDPALDLQARKMCRGSVDTWCDVLVNKFNIAKLADAVDWKALSTLWEDRNVLVHRGAIVDAKHSAKTGAQVGTILTPTADEVGEAIDAIGAARYAIVLAVWDYMEPGMGAKLAGQTHVVVLESLHAGRWRQAEGLGRVQELFATDPQSAATGRVNRWLALDRLMGAEEIRDEVQTWDLTGLPATFQVARHVLLHQDEDAVRLIQVLLAEETLTIVDLATWPLFARLRDEGRLADSLSNTPADSLDP
ncbi:hypothetical protein ABH935_005843 [Catenulispora sp. GAS73]|uniref:hypothetical protein n=1 Tax=Catenulispora sp. GAS73 TaxID=3156269 RepID=UPI003512C1E6